MCGIFGYIGNRQDAAKIVLNGLKTLEYRGYDSWGIAVQQKTKNKGRKTKIVIEKQIGKIGNALLGTQFSAPSFLAIGHTRWATHGGVTGKNAHPHADCTKKLAVLHNGIIENFQELKGMLLHKGHTFASETDTEVIAHLLEDEMQSHNFPDAMRTTFSQLRGMNAIVAINTTSSEIVAAKNGSPLIVGIGNGEYFIASDTAGVLPYTQKIIFLKDNEMILLRQQPQQTAITHLPSYQPSFPLQTKTRPSVLGEKGGMGMTNGVDETNYSGLQLFTLPDGKEIAPEIETVTWSLEQTTKGTYDHFMLKEIYEQPTLIRNIAKTYDDQIHDILRVLDKAHNIFFIACGTAYHATLAGKYLFATVAKRNVQVTQASEFTAVADFITDKSVIMPLSQSGETIDVVEPLTQAKKKGGKIIALVNVLGSTVYRMSDHKILLGAGPEKAVASTKAYIAKLSVLTMITYALAGKLADAEQILLRTAEEIERLLSKDNVDNIKKIAKKLVREEHLYILGRGNSYATALEGALKIKEVSYIHTEGLAGGELKHGTIALIDSGTPCIILAPDDETYDAIISNAMEVKARGGYIIGIAAKKHPVFDAWIMVNETKSPVMTQIIPLQLLAYHLATLKKLDPDKPRNLAKSVTVK